MLSQIDTIVMLMLENRSLDNVLGWLYHQQQPPHVVPSGSSPRFDGIPPNAVNFYRTTAYSPAQGTKAMHQPCRVPRWDPYEPFEHVEVQLFADGNGTMPASPWSAPAGMTGFVHDFHAFYTADQEVMGAYSADQLPVLYGLASNFAVSDRWFASVPTQTDANRAFSICGTSLGGLDNGTPATYDARTLFNALVDYRSFGIYWQYHGIGSGDAGIGPCYTLDLFPQIYDAVRLGAGVVQPYSAFLDALANGVDIPQFCYLEPFWGVGKGYLTGNDFIGVQGNDYHPPTWIGPAEYDLNELYSRLRASKQWAHMLFIITFDEHGGTWDHVPPTPTVPPDDSVTQALPDQALLHGRVKSRRLRTARVVVSNSSGLTTTPPSHCSGCGGPAPAADRVGARRLARDCSVARGLRLRRTWPGDTPCVSGRRRRFASPITDCRNR